MPLTFTGRGTPIAAADFAAAIAALGCDAASLWSLVAVETRGFGYLADRRPQILFERHIFCARTGGRFTAAHPDLSNPASGGYAGGAAEYDRLARAMALDETAALESASWGLGQVMGFNARKLGFADVHTMVAAMVGGEAAQLQAVVKFIALNPPLLRAFQTRVWARAAFYYNGSGYAKNHYDTRLEQEYELYVSGAGLPNLDLRTAQACLTYLGFVPRGVDGILGHGARVALLAYRKSRHLPPGGLDAAVLAQLKADANV